MRNCETFAGAARGRASAGQRKCCARIAGGFLAILLALASKPACTAEPPSKASTSHAAHDDALRAIPLDKLPAEVRPRVAAVLNDTSLFRRLPVQVVDCEPE